MNVYEHEHVAAAAAVAAVATKEGAEEGERTRGSSLSSAPAPSRALAPVLAPVPVHAERAVVASRAQHYSASQVLHAYDGAPCCPYPSHGLGLGFEHRDPVRGREGVDEDDNALAEKKAPRMCQHRHRLHTQLDPFPSLVLVRVLARRGHDWGRGLDHA